MQQCVTTAWGTHGWVQLVQFQQNCLKQVFGILYVKTSPQIFQIMVCFIWEWQGKGCCNSGETVALGSANATTPLEMLNSVLFVSFFFLLKFFSNPLWESEKLYIVLLVLFRSWTVSENSQILEVVLDIGFQGVSCWLLLLGPLVILGSVCILTLIRCIKLKALCLILRH